MPALRNNAFVRIDFGEDAPPVVNELTEEELLAIQNKLHLRIYEPVTNDTAEILFNDDGDILMEWSGEYVT